MVIKVWFQNACNTQSINKYCHSLTKGAMFPLLFKQCGCGIKS